MVRVWCREVEVEVGVGWGSRDTVRVRVRPSVLTGAGSILVHGGNICIGARSGGHAAGSKPEGWSCHTRMPS